jgi:hypothetical protein
MSGGVPMSRFALLLAQLAAEWWLAETDSGRLVGFARTIQRGGLVELTEFSYCRTRRAEAWDASC